MSIDTRGATGVEVDVEALLGSMTLDHWPLDEPKWQARVAAEKRAAWVAEWRLRFTPWRRRSTSQVRRQYEQVWTKGYPDIASPGGGSHVIWRGEVYRIPKFGLNRFYIAFVSAAIASLQPRTVLEIGSGNGLNLLVLAGMHPAVRFTGVE